MARGIAMSLSLSGLITEPTLKADRVLAWFFASRRNQCIVIREIGSYMYIKETYQGTDITPEDFCNKVADGLKRELSYYFDEVDVTGTPKYITAKGSVFTCYLTGTFIEEGKTYDLTKAILINNKTFELIDRNTNLTVRDNNGN